jgi:Uma2 family endonuclease
MSTSTRQSRSLAADWVPSPLARLTVGRNDAMVDSGIFTKRDRLMLINGYLVAKVPKNPPHVLATYNVQSSLGALISTGWSIRTEAPVRIPDHSEPEPDVSVARGLRNRYAKRHPGPADVAMVVEIAVSSVPEDRKLVRVYGPEGIPVYWIVNLKANQVEVYNDPGPTGYAKRQVFKFGHAVPVVIDGVEIGRIAVADILPPTDSVEA